MNNKFQFIYTGVLPKLEQKSLKPKPTKAPTSAERAAERAIEFDRNEKRIKKSFRCFMAGAVIICVGIFIFAIFFMK